MRFLVAIPVLALAAAMLGAQAVAAQRGYLFSVVGRVLSADSNRGTLVLQHGQLDTMAPGRERCQAPPSTLKHLRPGMMITATADTSHRPWRLRDVRPFGAAPSPSLTGRTVAILAR